MTLKWAALAAEYHAANPIPPQLLTVTSDHRHFPPVSVEACSATRDGGSTIFGNYQRWKKKNTFSTQNDKLSLVGLYFLLHASPFGAKQMPEAETHRLNDGRSTGRKSRADARHEICAWPVLMQSHGGHYRIHRRENSGGPIHKKTEITKLQSRIERSR